MDAIVLLGGIVLFNWIALQATGISNVMRVHGRGDTGEVIRVGLFQVRPKGLLRNLWIFGGLVRASVSPGGLHLSSIFPMTWKSAFVAWHQIRIEADPGATRFWLGFVENPEIEWSMTKIFVAKLQHTITTSELKETPFRALLS